MFLRAFGWLDAVCLCVAPLVVSHALGSYLFYVQHNFVDVKLRARNDWDYTHAALESSSMLVMSPLMHWFTGNIGYHHVHHLNHRIPFYKLPVAMADLECLQSPIRSSLRPGDIVRCLRLAMWDPTANRMITIREWREHPGGA